MERNMVKTETLRAQSTLIRAALIVWLAFPGYSATAADRPNLIWIMADDLGYGDLGCYGQQVISTPHLDRMAREGLRFTHFYAGATVCAPSRSVLMTGQHHGQTRVRGNSGPTNPAAQALRAADVTVAKMLQQSGYRTALIGKWGLGDIGAAETGLPRKQGFDQFFGYLNQRHAHNHFPDFLWRNEDRIALPNFVIPVGGDGAGYATKAVQFADDLFADEALQFVAQNSSQPFFLYWSMVIPHANNERTRELKNGAQVPDFGPYADKDWPDPDKGQAAMISRMDSYVGRMLAALRQHGLAEKTLVIFTSDNGPHNESNHSLTRFNPSGPLSGIKRSLTDGGIRVPMIAWWPGKVPAGSESDHVGYFGDWMATAAELAQTKIPDGCDSISFVPTLLGKQESQRPHEFLYWEFHEGGFKQAALYQGRWKGIRSGGPDAPIVLYDQQTDIGEKTNVAAKHHEIVAKINQYLRQARSDSPDWEPKWTTGKRADNSPVQSNRAQVTPSAVPGRGSRSPNVIVILADDQGSMDLGCYGAKDLQTPHTDGLAARGVRFTQFYSAAPVCSPSRAGLLTGRWPVRAGVPDNCASQAGGSGALPPHEITLAEMFHDAGYATGHIGKWHIGYTPETSPHSQGFDHSFGHMGGCIDNFSHFFYWSGPNLHDLWRNGREVYHNGEYFPDLMTSEAEQFMQRNRDKPFFLYYALNTPHYPYQGDPKWLEYFKSLPAPRRYYAAFLAAQDERLGRLLGTVDTLGLREQTIIVFQSDNGHSTEERAHYGGGSAGPYRGAKFSLFEGGIRLPAIIAWPGRIPANETRDQVGHACDWLPTLAQLTQVKPPSTSLDGRSLVDVIHNPNAASPHAGHPLHWQVGAGANADWAVRDGDWKLIGQTKDTSDGRKIAKVATFLVDLKSDPAESTNVADRHPEIVTRLQGLHAHYLD